MKSEFKEANLYDRVAEKSPDRNGHLILSILESALQQKKMSQNLMPCLAT